MAVKKPAVKPASVDALTNIFNEYRTGVQTDTDAIARRLQSEEDRARSSLGSLAVGLNGPAGLAQEVSQAPTSQASMFRSNLLSGAGNAMQASRGRELGAKTGLTSMLSYLQKVGDLQKQQGALQQRVARARSSGGGRRGGSGGGSGGAKDQALSQWRITSALRGLESQGMSRQEAAAALSAQNPKYAAEIHGIAQGFTYGEEQDDAALEGDARAEFLGFEGQLNRHQAAKRIALAYGEPDLERYLLDFAEQVKPSPKKKAKAAPTRKPASTQRRSSGNWFTRLFSPTTSTGYGRGIVGR